MNEIDRLKMIRIRSDRLQKKKTKQKHTHQINNKQ